MQHPDNGFWKVYLNKMIDFKDKCEDKCIDWYELGEQIL